MANGKIKIWVDIVMVIAVIISILISSKSCQISDIAEKTAHNAVQISKESNKIAKEALDTSKYQFIQVNRPYLIVGPAKYDNGEFWKITQESNVVVVNFKYKIKNVGNVAAKDIKIPDKIVLGPKTKLSKGAPLLFQKETGKVTLGPGDDYIFVVGTKLGYEDEDKAKKNLEYFRSDRSEGVTFQISVEYANELDGSQRYRTFMMNKIHNDTAKIIKSEMLNISEESDQGEN